MREAPRSNRDSLNPPKSTETSNAKRDTQNELIEKARQLSAEGLQVVTKNTRQVSAEGLEAVLKGPYHISAEGLEVAPDPSPEVVQPYGTDEKDYLNRRRRNDVKNWILNRKFYGVRVIWIGITILFFVTGIVFGGAIVAIIESKGTNQLSSGSQSGQYTSTPSTSVPQTSSNLPASPVTPTATVTTASFSTDVTSAESTILATAPSTLSTTSAAASATSTSTSASSTNLQTFTGALGGVAADPIESTGNATRPFSVDGDTFTDFASALQRSCSNQHDACADLANTLNSQITIGECDNEQVACLATGSATTKL